MRDAGLSDGCPLRDDHSHLPRLEQPHDLTSDAPVADHAERPPLERGAVREVSPGAPVARPEREVALPEAVRGGEHEGDSGRRHRMGDSSRRDRHGDSPLAAGGYVDEVEPHAVAGDDREPFDALETGPGDGGGVVIQAVDPTEQVGTQRSRVLGQERPFDARVFEGRQVVRSKHERPLGSTHVAGDADTEGLNSVVRHAVSDRPRAQCLAHPGCDPINYLV